MNFVLYQLGQLAASLVFGMLLAFYYDLYRLLSVALRLKRAALYFTDLLWWLSALLFFSWFWYVLLSGEMRLSLFLWQALGFGFYLVYLSPFFKRVSLIPAPRGQKPGGPALPKKEKSGLEKMMKWPARGLFGTFDLLGKSIWVVWDKLNKIRQKVAALRLFQRQEPPPPDENDGIE